MPRLASCFALLLAVGFARGDSFDYYTNRHLQKATQSPLAEKSAKVTLEDLVTTSQVLPGLPLGVSRRQDERRPIRQVACAAGPAKVRQGRHRADSPD